MAIDWRRHITMDPGLHHGRPVIRGMRISVQDLLDYLAGGMSVEEILADFPELTREDVQACFAFAAEQVRERGATV